MTAVSSDEIERICLRHSAWRRNYEDSERARIRGMNLSGRDELRGADLYGAEISSSDLSGSDLRRANLSGTCISGVRMLGTALANADLSYAIVSGCSLQGANLEFADLHNTTFRNCDLRGARLSGANLLNTDFDGCNLTDACLSDTLAMPQCPDEGEFIAWKCAGNGQYIVKLFIPVSAERTSGTSRACRASKAKVLAIQNPDGTDSGLSEVSSDWKGGKDRLVYRIGETAVPDSFDPDRWHNRTHGIHFFISRADAEEACRRESAGTSL